MLMARSEDSRWSAPGPWQLRTTLCWYPLGASRHWCRLPLRCRRVRVPSGAAALQATREQLRRGATNRAHPLQLEVEARDGANRLAWRGNSEASLRREARSAAGWQGEPTAGGPSTVLAEALEPSTAGGLTAAQQRVVAHGGGPAVVLAVAGAGKTTTMVERVRELVARGASPESILVTSFSRAAVADVRAKLERAAPPDLSAVEVRTFHSLAHSLLREASTGAGATAPPGPPPEQVSARLLELVIGAWRREGHALAADLTSLDHEAFLAYRARCLAELSVPDPDGRGLPPAARRLVRHAPPDPEAPLHAPLLAAHERLRRERGWRDYDDLVVDAWAALMSDPQLRERTCRRFRHRIVDEFQDVNLAQVALLEALLDESGEVMMIGDDDQSIYGFRGSDPTLLHAVAERLRARRYVLDLNFRGRPETLAAAASLMEAQSGRLPKRLRSARAPGGTTTLDEEVGSEAEAARAIARLLEARSAGYGWQRQAILVRTFSQTSVLELALLREDIPYALLGAPDFLHHPVCRAALAGLHLVAVAEAPVAVRALAWRRWLAALGLNGARAAERGARLARCANGGAAALTVEGGRDSGARERSVLAATERLAAAAEAGLVPALRAAANELLPWPKHGRTAATLRAFTSAAEEGLLGARSASVEAFLESLVAARRSRSRPEERVCLTSAHRSKGLEWDVVVVPGQALGIFPVREDHEERRLAYVAWTRARERLHLLRDTERPPSPYLVDAELAELIELQRDLAWCRAGIGTDSVAARWARQDARRRFGDEARGTRDPRRPSA